MFEYISTALGIIGTGWSIYVSWKIFRYFSFEKGNTELDHQRDRKNVIVIGHQTCNKSIIKTITSDNDDYISIDTYEEVSAKLKEISTQLGPNAAIEIYLHTPGGDLFYSQLIANMLFQWKGPTKALIIGYAASGGTLIALSCDHIVMSPDSALGPIDPQLASMGSTMSISVVDCQDLIMRSVTDKSLKTYLICKMSQKMMPHYYRFLNRILSRNYGLEHEEILNLFIRSRVHSTPIFYDECKEVGLHVVMRE